MEVKKQNPGIHGVVADLIHVEKRYETARFLSDSARVTET